MVSQEFRTKPSLLKKFDLIGPFLLGCVYAIGIGVALVVMFSLMGMNPEQNAFARLIVVSIALVTPAVSCLYHLMYWLGVESKERCSISDDGVMYHTPFNKEISMRWQDITSVCCEDDASNDGPSSGSKTIVTSTADKFTINDLHFGSEAFYALRQAIRLKSPPAAKKVK